jgi:hypothetical protein
MPNTEGAINIVLRYLRAIDRKVDRLIDHNRDVKARVPALEASLARVLDRMETRLDRIERRRRSFPTRAKSGATGAGKRDPKRPRDP